MGLKRTDNEKALVHAIENLEKKPQNRKNRRILATLRAKFDKLVPEIEDPETAEAQP